ncbi:hypothetical protein B5F90_09895, partial [Alistipes sp. An31A]|uniref:hypothetical protein n=1 Tax=Alistipes sp. An31A TaxID=1965631 RepID=UPI000B56884A
LEVFFLSLAKIQILYYIGNQFIMKFYSFYDSPYVSNWYLQINMSAKQQNREPAKHYVSKTTKQCVNTTAKQQNRKTQTSVSQY